MEYLVSPEEMKQMDARTINDYGIPSMVLMERAALQTAAYIETRLKAPSKILIAAGTGNNGGDGIAIGRILAQRGYAVTFVLCGESAKCTKETKQQIEICMRYGYHMIGKIPKEEYDIVVDALFGIGLNKPVVGNCYEIIKQINAMSGIKIAVDIPSGVHAGSGKILGLCVEADATLTFAFKKIGQILYPGAAYCGELICKDIGITRESYVGENPLIYSYQSDDIKKNLPKRNPAGNKGGFGKILLAAGSINMSGACVLSGLSAYRTGTGLIRIYTPWENREIIQRMLPEAILTTYDSKEPNMQTLREAYEWADCIAAGPGIGTGEGAVKIVRFLLQEASKPFVIDADALNIIAMDRELLESIKHKKQLIMTPHVAEFSRISGYSIEEIKKDIIACAKRFAEEYGVTLVCKDARTVCCTKNSADTGVYLNQSGNDGMATAGSGDVLTGIIAGLVAQGMNCHEAAVLGVYLHGCAGDRVLLSGSRYSLMASDMIEQLKYVLNEEPNK